MSVRAAKARAATYSAGPAAVRPLDGPEQEPAAAVAPAEVSAVPAIVLVLGAVVILALRFLGLEGYPTAADEGGWPLSVRRFVEDGERTFDYFKAPGFHWQLWAPFELFGASIGVARAAASTAGLVGLLFFHRLARLLLPGARQAWVATLLLGTSYAAVLIDRRALIEPFLVAWMVALAFFALRRARHDGWWVALCTAGVLLTKASGIFLLPVLGLVALVGDGSARGDAEGRAGTWRVVAGLAGGVALACAAFFALYRSDPFTFLDGWMPTLLTASTSLAVVPEPTVPHLGRFGIDPAKVMDWLGTLARDEPFLFALGVAGMTRGIVEGRQRAMSLWLLGGMAFLLAQTHVLENHLAVLYAPLALLAAWLLADLDRTAVPRRVAGVALTWCRVLVAAIVGFGAVRAAGAIALTTDPSLGATRWVEARRAPGEAVLAAPFVLMRLEGPVAPFVALPAPYAPEPEALATLGVRWVIVDAVEWRGHAARFVEGRARFEAALARCCTPDTTIGGFGVYRVVP